MSRLRYARWAATIALVLTHAPLGAQERPRGGIGGSVIDAASGAPIEAAAISLQPEVVGVFPAGPASGSAFTTAARTVLSRADGTYRFDDLSPGVYRIYVSRIGYRPYSVTVELRTPGLSPVGMALNAEPIPLQAVRPRAIGLGSYQSRDTYAPNESLARLLAVDQRRMRFLTTDTREITHADVVEAVTLGEPDVMRALQRLPGVTTRSDYTAELWTRGAPWSHTRVYYDGVPLFNPLHALGVVSGIGSNAIGTVWFHPGVRSAGMGEGAAGVVDLQSRRASGDGRLNVNADLSLLNAALALDQRVLDGRAGWMVSARQTYVDWMTRLGRHASERDDSSFPYAFSEVAGKVDAWVGERSAVEASWLWERDRLTSDHADEQESLRASWGNAAARVAMSNRIGRMQLHHSVGLSTHNGTVEAIDESTSVPQSADQLKQSETVVQYLGFHGTLSPEPASLAGPSWSLGYGIERQKVGYYGPQVLPVPRFMVTSELGFAASDNVTTEWEWSLPVAVVWGEHNWSLGERFGVRTGVRVEASDEVAESGRVRVAPRVSARFTPVPEVALSAGAARVFQYAQAIAPSGVYVASLATTDVWLLAGPTMPALRSDIVTAGAEAWLATGRSVSINAFARRATGVASSDPRPGRLYTRPAYVVGSNTASGVELSVRQVSGRITGSASYTLSRSEMDAVGVQYAASADRPHVFNTTVMVRASSALRAGAAFTAASGVPFTRTIATVDDCENFADCDANQLPWVSAPNATRAPTYASLDLLVDWSGRFRSLDIGVYAQLRNALGRENATIYTGEQNACLPAGCNEEPSSAYERGIPRLPVIGIRVRR